MIGSCFFYNALNFAIRKINEGAHQFGKHVLKWYKLGLEKEILFRDGFISPSTFQNIIHNACKYEEFAFAKEFIESYQINLKEELRNDSVAYGWGLFYFYQNDFEKTISILISENWEKSHQLSGRTLLVRAYFENYLLDRSQYFFLENAIHAFEIFLLRNKQFPRTHLEPYLNLIRTLKGLSKKLNGFKSKREIQNWLNRQVQKKGKIISKSWLLDLDI